MFLNPALKGGVKEHLPVKGETLFVESVKEVIAKHQIKYDRFDELREDFDMAKGDNSNLELWQFLMDIL